MALQWIIGDFKTGSFTTSRLLPAVASASENISHDIHCIDEATVTLSKRDLPSPALFETYLKPGERMVALEDTAVAWNAPGRILYAGVVMKINSKPKDVVKLRVSGVREWLARRIITSTLTGQVHDPNAGFAATGATYRDATISLFRHAFTGTSGNTGVPTIFNTFPTPAPGNLGSTFLNSDFMDYSSALDEIASIGPGTEVRMRWAWTSSAMTLMKFTLEVGTDTQPQIEYGKPAINISLDDEAAKVITYGQTLSMDGSATRLISQSKAGDLEAKDGSDFNAIIKTSSTQRVLWDQTFNPGVELTAAQMTAQTGARIDHALLKRGEAELSIVGDRQEWLSRLGRKLNIVGSLSDPDLAGYSIQVRITEVNFADATSVIKLKIQPLEVKFPKLPKKNKSPNRSPGSQGGNSIGGVGGIDTTLPVIPRPIPNQPLPGGGGGLTPPTFEPPIWEASKPFFVNLKPTVTNMHGGGGDRTGEINTFPIGDTSSAIVMRPSSWSSTFSAGLEHKATHSSSADCEEYFNTSPRMRMGANTSPSNSNAIEYFNFHQVSYSKTAAPVVSPLFTFVIADHFTTWTEWQNGKAMSDVYSHPDMLDMDHSTTTMSHKATINGVAFVHSDEVYLWIYSSRNIGKEGAVSNIEDTTGAIVSTRLYKNALTGSSSTWQLVGQDITDDTGRIFFPYTHNSVVSSRSGLYLYGGLRVDGNGIIGYTGDVEQIRIEEASYKVGTLNDLVEYPTERLNLVQQPYYDSDLMKLTGSSLTREPQYIAIPDNSLSERASLGSAPSIGYGPPYSGTVVKKEPLSLSAPHMKYFAKRSGRAQAVAVFQLPAWNLRPGIEIPEASDFSPDSYHQLSVFSGDTTGNLTRFVEMTESASYYKNTANFVMPVVGYVDGWYVILYWDGTAQIPGFYSIRTKGSGGTWVKAFESNLTSLRMGGAALGRNGWRGRDGYNIGAASAPTLLNCLSGMAITSYGNYGLLTAKQSGTSLRLQAVSFEIDGTL